MWNFSHRTVNEKGTGNKTFTQYHWHDDTTGSVGKSIGTSLIERKQPIDHSRARGFVRKMLDEDVTLEMLVGLPVEAPFHRILERQKQQPNIRRSLDSTVLSLVASPRQVS